MSDTEFLQLFEEQPIRSAWDEEEEEWYFSVVDVVGVLTESPNPGNYWKVLKRRLRQEGNELVTNCNQLKLKSPRDGKRYLTDVANTEQILRIIQSIPSKKAEPFKLWLAQVGRERLTEYLVVGAGAAGCAFGFLMERSGADVLLLEMKNAEQRVKLCAGILEPRAEAAFYDVFGQTVEEAGLAPMRIEAMCVWDERNELSRAMPGCSTATDVPGGTGSQPQKSLGDSLRGYLRTSGKALMKKIVLEALGVEPGGSFTFRALPRKRFDDFIRDRFLAEGGRILYHTKVLSVNDEAGLAECMDLQTKEVFSLRYRYLICADGAVSNVRRLLTGRQPRVYLALEAAVPLIRREAVGRLTKRSQGYCWYIPRGEDATVGCGYHNLGADAVETCHKRLTEFCEELGITPPPRFSGAFIPEGDDVLLRIGTRTYLLGDAAGLNDAFTGGGIHYALLSARALAASLAGAGNRRKSSSAPDSTSSFAGTVTYEEAMQPHVNYVKKSSANLKQYYTVACSVVSGFGKRRV